MGFLKNNLGSYISVYLFSFIILCLLFYAFKTLFEKGFMGVTSQQGPWNYKGQERLLQLFWKPRPAISSLTFQACATLPAPHFPFPALLSPFLTVLPYLHGTPRLPKANLPPSSPHPPNLPAEGTKLH